MDNSITEEVYQKMNGADEQGPSNVPLVFGNFGQIAPRVAYVCSVHYESKFKKMPHQGETVYRLPAPAKGSYSVLAVYDTQQWVKTSAGGYDEEPTPTAMPVDVNGVVRDLLASWTTGFIGEASRFTPGIMQIAGPVPTEMELYKLNRKEEDFCDALIMEGDKFYVQKNGRIQSLHRGAATWREQAREWNIEIRKGETHKKGAASGKIIPMEAMVDDGVDLIDFYEKHEMDPMDFNDRFIRDLLLAREAKRNSKKSKLPTPPSN
jgi:hypothetical protein